MNKDEVISALFAARAASVPDRPAIRFRQAGSWHTVTYAQLLRRAQAVSTFLARAGLKKGERAVILMENRPAWIEAYLGIVHAGLVAVPLDNQIHADEAAALVKDSQARVIFTSGSGEQKLNRPDVRSPARQVIVAGKDVPQGCLSLEDIEGTPPAIDRTPESLLGADAASLIYTSGTTAQPKGVLLSHANLCANFRSITALDIVKPDDNFLAFLPLHHTYPFMVTCLVPLLLGATVTFVPDGFNPKDLASFIREGGVSILTGVPQLFAMLHEAVSRTVQDIPPFLRPLADGAVRRAVRKRFGPGFRYAVSGGARLDPDIARQLTRWGMHIIEGYGLTETAPVVSLNRPDQVRFGSAGQPLPGVEVAIDSPDQRREGEILIKGPNVTAGYYNNPEETRALFTDGWLRSGDLGYLDQEGYLFITGRKKEVIVLATGKNIYPQELEDYYAQSPYIKELCVFEKEESSFGRKARVLFAVVVPDTDYFKVRKESNMQSRIRWELENLGKALPSYKHVMGFVLSLQPLPRTALNKLQRYRVSEMVRSRQEPQAAASEAQPGSPDLELLADPIAAGVMAYVKAQLKRSVSLDSHLEIDLGIDSLTRVELGLGLESLFHVGIPDETLYTVATVRDIILKVKEIVSRGEVRQSGIPGANSWSELLSAPLPPGMLRRVSSAPLAAQWCVMLVVGTTLTLAMRLFWMLRVRGREHLPRGGPFLICPNHGSYLDGIAVFAALPWRVASRTYFLGYARILELPIFKWGLRAARLLTLNPDTDLVHALKSVAFVIRRGEAVCVFPEGQRSIDGQVGPFKKGVGILLKELDIRAVPVYIKNSHASWPRTRLFPRFFVPLEVTFGPSLTAGELAALHPAAADTYEAIAQGLRDRVLLLQRC